MTHFFKKVKSFLKKIKNFLKIRLSKHLLSLIFVYSISAAVSYVEPALT